MKTKILGGGSCVPQRREKLESETEANSRKSIPSKEVNEND